MLDKSISKKSLFYDYYRKGRGGEIIISKLQIIIKVKISEKFFCTSSILFSTVRTETV